MTRLSRAERDAEILRLGREGMTHRAIGERLSVDRETVGRALRAAGIHRVPGWKKRAPEVDRQIVALVTGTDLTYAEIGQQVGYRPETVCVIAKANGAARGTGVRADPHRDKRIAELWAQGATRTAIQAEVGISSTGLTHAGKRLGLPPRTGGGLTDLERDKRIAALWAQGVTRAAVAAEVGISDSGLSKAVRRLDLPRRKAGRPRAS